VGSWWDEEWKKNTISDIGGLDAFNQEYDLQFRKKIIWYDSSNSSY
jgi:hypothetical protein